MESVIKLNLFEDKPLQRKVNIMSLVFSLAAILLLEYFYKMGQVSYKAFFYATLLILLIICIHELIHGYFFKRYANSNTKIQYGFKSGFFYAANPGYVYTTAQFKTILLAPCTILTTILLLLAIFSSYPPVYLTVAILHFGSCAGDIFMTRIIDKANKECRVEGIRDMEYGMDILVGEKL